METTKEGTIEKLEAREIAELSPHLAPFRELVGKTIVEVRDVEGYSAFGTKKSDHDGPEYTWPFVIVCDDGTVSQVAGHLAEHSFAMCPVDGLIGAGLVTSEQVADLQARQDKAMMNEQEIKSLREERLGLIHKLTDRHGFKAYRGLARQIKGVDDRLQALGALK